MAKTPRGSVTAEHDPTAEGVDRRRLLTGSVAAAGAAGLLAASRAMPATAAEAIGENQPPWMTTPGESFRIYGKPSVHEDAVVRTVLQPYGALAPGAGVAMTPLQSLNGIITPNGLHFERSHNGIPQIDPDEHEFLIHGLVRRALKFRVEDLVRYAMQSSLYFIECSGNSFFNSNLFPEPMQVPVGMIHGLVSGAEWTGVPLAVLLDEAGVEANGKWILAEGADAAGMSRSVPIEKCLDDALIAFYQNGERLRPEQGYPMRLLLPGWEGNMSVKWLRRIKVTAGPTHTKDETSKYTDLMPDGMSRQFTYTMDVKSTITRPAGGLTMTGAGFYEIAGLAWSGHGRIKRVEVSTDGGQQWVDAHLDAPVLPKALTRFRVPWSWDGAGAILQSRATDEKGNVQVPRDVWSQQYASGHLYHCNAIQSWHVQPDGSIENVYA